MKKVLFLLFVTLLASGPLWADDLPVESKFHGKALKEKEQEIEIINSTPTRSFQKLAPLWASKDNMDNTMKDIRKQAAQLDADAVIQIQTHTEEVKHTDYDPTFWGEPVGWGGYGPWGAGPWGGVGYWGGYVSAHTTPQPVVQGWAVKWTGPAQ